MKYIDLGYVNDWSAKATEFYRKVRDLMKEDPTFETAEKALGRCESEYEVRTDFLSLRFRVDSSD